LPGILPPNEELTMRPRTASRKRFLSVMGLLVLCMATGKGWAQEAAKANAVPEPSLNDSIRQLQAQIQQLQSAVREIKEEAENYRAETLELKHELQTTRARLDLIAPAKPRDGAIQAASDTQSGAGSTENQSVEGRVARLEEDQQLLDSKVTDQYQTKVESGSKYRVKLSGILLFNLFSNTGY